MGYFCKFSDTIKLAVISLEFANSEDPGSDIFQISAQAPNWAKSDSLALLANSVGLCLTTELP